MIATLYGDAFVVLSTGCAVFLYISYVMPVAAGLLSEGHTWKRRGPFNLGVWSRPVAVLAIISRLVLAWVGFQPPNEKVLYLTIAMIVVMIVIWYSFERCRFAGPPTGASIAQRQAEIAAVEERLRKAG